MKKPTAVQRLSFAFFFLLASLCSLPDSFAQTGAPPSIEVDYIHDTGVVENTAGGPTTIISFTVEVPGAEWVRLFFDQVRLAGDVGLRTGSTLRMTSWRDGAVQEFNSIHAR